LKVGDLVRHTEFRKLMGIVVEVEFNSEPSFQSLVTVYRTDGERKASDRICFYEREWEVVSESR